MRPRCPNCHRWLREGSLCASCELSPRCRETNCRNLTFVRNSRCRSCAARAARRDGVCTNCKRRHYPNPPAGLPSVRLRLHNIANITVGLRYKFAILQIEPTQTHVMLCEQCYSYLSTHPAQNGSYFLTWPCFVWSVLSKEELHVHAWILLPVPWREWWYRSMVVTHGTTLTELQSSPSLFYDITHDCNLDNKAVSDLIWTGLMSRETSLVIPEIKCPAGCSEYKHRSNDLPLDIVWEECLQTQVTPLMTQPIRRDFVHMFRRDYLRVEYHAQNPAFACKPSVAFNSSGYPVVLCCRHHDKHTNKLFVHAPKNPTGSISSSLAGGTSPTVPVPRTLRTARMSKYSASFQMAYMEGSYYGLDTMFLSSNSHVTSANSTLGWKQDVLTYAGRKDIRGYTRQRYHKTWDMPGCIGAQLDACAKDIYPYMPELRSKFLGGASHVPIRDAVSMQQAIDFGAPETGWYTDRDGNERRLQFKGAYPRRIVWVHPAVSTRGCRPPLLPHYDKQAHIDTRTAWILSSMMLLVPEFWCAVAEIQNKKDCEWEGNLLTYLTWNSLTHIQPQPSSNNPFRRMGVKKLINTFFSQDVTVNGEFCMATTRAMLGLRRHQPDRFKCVSLSAGVFPCAIDRNTTIVVVTRDYDNTTCNNTWVPSEQTTIDARTWKLCYIAQTYANHNPRNPNDWGGSIYCRYSNDNMHDWWNMKRRMDLPTAANFDIATLPVWDVCVYVIVDSYVHTALRDQMLESCSGQGKVYCRVHNFPLITTASKEHNLQCCCREGELPDPDFTSEDIRVHSTKDQCTIQAIFECASDDCSNSICKNHYTSVLEWPGKFYIDAAVTCYGPAQCNGVPLQFNTSQHTFPAGLSDNSEDDALSAGDDEALLHDEGSCGEEDAESTATEDPCDEHHLSHPLDTHEMDGEAFEAHFRLFENMDPETFATSTNHGMDDIEDCRQAESNGDTPAEATFTMPSTDAGADPLFTYIDKCDYSHATATNHVLLNNFGHMLIRRNTKLNGTLQQRNFLQRMVARVPGDSLPLAYPEGMLFSNLFPYDMVDGSLVGCLPSAALNSERVLGELGFASLEDHFRTRLSNPGILASTDPKYHFFAFDCLSNLGLRGCDSRVILRRGFAEIQDAGGVRFRGNDEPLFDTEQVDSRPIVNKLAAAVNEKPPTYFYTHTCSMKTHFGMKIIWDWLQGDAVLNQLLDGHESDQDRHALRRNIIDSCGVLLLRSWMEIMLIWIKYITKSSEKPIGEIDDYLFRLELQDAIANLPHLHSMLWTKDDLSTESGLNAALDRIRGFILDIIRPDERERYKNEGIFENDEHIVRFMEMMATFLRHYHYRRCFAYVKSKDGDVCVETRCKANDNYKDNPYPSQHTEVPLNIKHSDDAARVLSLLGLGSVDQYGRFTPSHDKFRATKHHPPAHGNEGIISPVFGALVARNPNMSNAQFPTGYTLSRYLAKYIVSIDLYNVINITPPRPQDDKNTMNITGTELPNQKITGNRIHHLKESGNQKARVIKQRRGRAVNVAEFYMLLFGYSPIMTNIKFEQIVTRTYDERAARPRVKPLDRLRKQESLQHVALTPTNTIPPHYVQQFRHFPAWRKFLPSQIDTIFDDLQSPLSTSRVTIFSARPPELLFVAKQPDYQRCFMLAKIKGNLEEVIHWITVNTDPANLYSSAWVDGFNNHVKIRAAAIPYIMNLLQTVIHPWFSGYIQMLALFEDIEGVLHLGDRTEEQTKFLAHFVCEIDNPKLPVVWFESVRPTRNNRFLIHLLLSMGSITTEYDLFTSPSLRHCFVKARLLDLAQPEFSAHELVRSYVLEQLACLPAGTNTFDKYLVAAYNCILELFLHDRLYSDEVPTAIYTRARDETADRIVAHLATKKLQLLRHARTQIRECGITNLPTEHECITATFMAPHPWDPLTIQQAPQQPMSSYEEQISLLKLAKHLIQHYKVCATEHTKGLCQVGAAGVGKTTVLLIEVLYAICQGLNTGITALLSERAQELSGGHIHDLFAMKGRDTLSPGAMAERACAALYRNPEKLEYLRTLDVLALDEAGAVPCEILSAMCTVLRYIRNSNRPYGGLLIFATMDYLQIEPVHGRHPLLSPTFTSAFFFRELLHSVRAALDASWRRVQEITRLPLTELLLPATRSEFIALFTTTCSFVYDLDDPNIPRNILYAFGKKAPIRQQEKRILEKLRASNSIPFLISTANDEERTIDGNFRPASTITSLSLDRQVKEPRSLVLYKKGRYQITYNKQGFFSNSQLAVLFDMPTQGHIDAKKPLTLTVAPPGCRYIPDDTVTKEGLHNMGWKECQIATPKRHDVQNAAGSIRAKRQQYGLRHHIGSTIHAIMGQTLASLLTRVERGDRTHPYALWLAAQVVVLVSRTRLGAQTFFWLAPGVTPAETAEAIYDLLCKSTPFRCYLTNILRALCSGTHHNDTDEHPYVVNHATSVFRPRDTHYPRDDLGYVYLLVSNRDLSTIYIGSTRNLVKRWKQHNTGFAAKQTTPTRLRPWAILAYITGFDGNETKYTLVENNWIAAKEALRNSLSLVTVQIIHNLGKDIVVQHNRNNPNDNLRFVSCGTVEIRSAPP